MATAHSFFVSYTVLTEIHLREGAILEAIGFTLMGIYNKSVGRLF